MKTIIFLSQYRYRYYDIKKLFSTNQYRLVALLGPPAFSQFPEEYKKYFAKIYQIHENDPTDLSAEFTLDYAEACDAIAAEIATADATDQFILVCGDEFNISLMGKLQDQYQIPGPGYAKLLSYRDKTVMKEKLSQAGIRIPKFVKFDKSKALKNPDIYYKELTTHIGLPFIIKPVSGAVSYITKKIDDIKSFKETSQLICTLNADFEAEEFISGILYHCDSLIENDQILLSFASEYSYPNLTFTQGKVCVSIPLQEKDPLKKRIAEFSAQALKALGFINGVTHMELFLTPTDELVFLEVAARPPGGLAVPNYLKVYGVNLLDLHIQAQMNLPIKLPPLKIQEYSMFVLIPYYKGTILRLNEPQIQSSYKIAWKVKPGDIIPFASRSVIEIAGTILVNNNNYAILRRDFEILKDYRPMEMANN